MEKGELVIFRTYSAGVFAGEFESLEGQVGVLKNARRLWYWAGAASLSELSTRGTSAPEGCKFPCKVPEVTLMQVIEVLKVSPDAWESIEGVPEWTKH